MGSIASGGHIDVTTGVLLTDGVNISAIGKLETLVVEPDFSLKVRKKRTQIKEIMKKHEVRRKRDEEMVPNGWSCFFESLFPSCMCLCVPLSVLPLNYS
jgi:hypothetical protein